MRKKQTRRSYVTFAIANILLASILFMNNNQFQNLLAQNNNSSTSNSNTTIVNAVTTTKNPYSVNNTTDKGVVTMKTTPALTSSNPANVILGLGLLSGSQLHIIRDYDFILNNLFHINNNLLSHLGIGNHLFYYSHTYQLGTIL